MALIDTLHPVHEGRVFRWRDEESNDPAMVEYGRSDQGEGAATWQSSPFFHLLQIGEEEMRLRIGFGETAEFPVVQEMKDAGHTDYLVFVHRFAGDNAIGEMDCVYSSWVTRHPGGFCAAWCRRWRWPSRPPLSPASPVRWSKSISDAMREGAC